MIFPPNFPKGYFSILLIVAFAGFNCNSKTSPAIAKIENQFVIRNVSVIPMTENTVVKSQNVLIQNGKIVRISDTEVPSSATVIDGTGKFLLPGLTEMHAHIPVAQNGNDSLVMETLFLYLSQGVTTIRGMLGDPYHLGLKAKANAGQILSPRIYTSSPSCNGNSLPSVEVAIEKVRQYQKDGYDFLKIHPGIQLEVWNALEKTAKEVGIPYAGHVPVAVGIDRAIEAQYQTVDHLDGFVEGLVPASAKVDPTQNGFFGYNFTLLADKNAIESLVDKTLEKGVAVVPTQTLFTRWFSPTPVEQLINAPEMKYMAPSTRFAWRQSKSQMLNLDNFSDEQWQQFIDLRQELLRVMDQKGVTILLGSDAPQVYNVPGFSIHHEMSAMTAAGISTYNVLRSGTAQPAKFFQASGQYGTITEGAAADLILVEGNPLEDIRNAQRIAGVMAGTSWLAKEEIDRRLAAIAKNYEE